MDEAVKTYEHEDGSILEIFQDSDTTNPRDECDPLGTMVCFHRRYDIGDMHKFSHVDGFFSSLLTDYEGPYHLSENTVENMSLLQQEERICKGPYIMLRVYMYDHSIQLLSTESFIGRAQHAEWDSGVLGWIYTTPEKIREWFGVKGINKHIKARAEQVLRGEVETLSQWMSGDVYCYRITDPSDDDKDFYGCFYGHDIYDNGMYDCVPEKWQKVIDKEEGGRDKRRLRGFEYIG